MKEVNFDIANRIGLDGESAYEIDVAHGFEGTQQEWLASIREPALAAAAGAAAAAGNAQQAALAANTAAGIANAASQNMEYYEVAFAEGYYLNYTGKLTANAAYSVSDFIKVAEGDSIYYTGASGASTYAVFGYSDGTGKDAQVLLGNNVSCAKQKVGIPAGVTYVRISGRNPSFGAGVVPVAAVYYPRFHMQVSNLSIRTEDVRKRLLSEIPFSKGHGLKPEGDTYANSQYSITDYIPVTEGMLVEYRGIATAPNYAVGVYYDAERKTVSSLGHAPAVDTQYFTVPRGVSYLRLSGRNEDHLTSGDTPVRASVSDNLQKAFDEINSVKENLYFNEKYYKCVEFPHRAYIKADGTFGAISTFSRSDFLKVVPGELVKFSGCQGASSVGVACYGDADAGTFITALVGPGTTANGTELAVPENVNYIVMSGKNAGYSPAPDIPLAGLVKVKIHDDIAGMKADIMSELGANDLQGKRLSIIGDSLSAGEAAAELTILPSDVGRQISVYPTYADTGKVIGGVSVTASMVGAPTSFYPVADDVGKKIGETGGAESVGERWWKVLCRETGMVKLQNVSQNSVSLTSLQDADHALKATYAWHPSVIRRCAGRDGFGNTVTPDVIIIYRGTNDFSKSPYARLTGFGAASASIPETDSLAGGGVGFKEAYCLTIGKLREAYPEARIFICTLNAFKRINYGSFPVHNGTNTLPEFNNAIREVADFMGCGLIELDKSGVTFENVESYTNDLTHPNEAGHTLIGKKAAKDIMR